MAAEDVLNIFVIEDDLFHLEDTKITIEELGHVCIGHADDPFEAQEQISELSVDIALVDIHLHGKKVGIKLAKRINDLFKIPVLFTSSDRSHEVISEAADLSPVAYLTKPINPGDLQAALIMAQINSTQDVEVHDQDLFVKSGNKLVKVAMQDILFVHTDTKNYCTMVTRDGKKLTFRNSILTFHKLLDPDIFIQTHRSHLVNLKEISSYHESNQTLEIHDHQVPVGRTFKEEIYKRIKIL